jgi:hypothetical protein
MEFNNMSDTEINQKVTIIVEGFGEYQFYNTADGYPMFLKSLAYGCVVGEVRDYCNDPSEAWPIIIENKISIGFNSEGHPLVIGHKQFMGDIVLDKNPLRAEMIVFLKMNGDS